mgnify:CR=1 FL=1
MVYLVILAFIAILGSLGAALYYMMKGGQQQGETRPNHMARALAFRVGFSIALYPTSTLFAAAGSTVDLARRLRQEGSTRSVVPRMLPFDELNEVLGKDAWDGVEDELRGEA